MASFSAAVVPWEALTPGCGGLGYVICYFLALRAESTGAPAHRRYTTAGGAVVGLAVLTGLAYLVIRFST